MKKNLLAMLGAALLLVLNALAFSSFAGVVPKDDPEYSLQCYQHVANCIVHNPPILTYTCEHRKGEVTCNKPGFCDFGMLCYPGLDPAEREYPGDPVVWEGADPTTGKIGDLLPDGGKKIKP